MSDAKRGWYVRGQTASAGSSPDGWLVHREPLTKTGRKVGFEIRRVKGQRPDPSTAPRARCRAEVWRASY